MEDLASQISIWVILLPLTLGCIFYKTLDKQSRLVFFLVLLATPPQISTAFIEQSSSRYYLYNLYTIGEYILTYLFIGRELQSRLFKNIVLATVLLFFILVITESFTIGISARFLTEWVCFADISYLVWILSFILESALKDVSLPNSRNPLFWYLAGLILYASSTIFVFALYYYRQESQYILIKKTWLIHDIFNIILYSFYAIGFYQNRQYKRHLITL